MKKSKTESINSLMHYRLAPEEFSNTTICIALYATRKPKINAIHF